MKNIKISLLWFCLLFPFTSYGQLNENSNIDKGITNSNKLVGTWKLIEFADLDSITSQWKYRYGRLPRGYYTYTKNNIVNLNISSESPLTISEDSAKHFDINLSNLIDNYSLGYFGTYTIDFEKSIVIHHVKGGSIPWYIDTDQPRPFTLKNDTLHIGDNITWKRILVKVD